MAMNVYLPPALRVPAYTVDLDGDPVTLRVTALVDQDLVAEAQLADSLVVVAPGAERVPIFGRALGNYLAGLGGGGEPTYRTGPQGEYEAVIADARCRLEAEGRSLLACTHVFRDWCGLAVLVIVLAPHACLQATLRMPLDPQRLF